MGPEFDALSVVTVREAPSTHIQYGLSAETPPTGIYGDVEEAPRISFGFGVRDES